MVFEYTREISTTLISFGYSNALQILIAIFIILITIILRLWLTNSRAKQGRKNYEENENDAILRQGLQARIKQAQQKVLEEKLSCEDRDKEKEIELQSLEEVMKLLQERKDLFPESSMDDLKQQLNLYRTQ